MSDKEKDSGAQPDAGLGADQHPRPSQAEGDLETVEKDLAEKNQPDTPKQTAKTQA